LMDVAVLKEKDEKKLNASEVNNKLMRKLHGDILWLRTDYKKPHFVARAVISDSSSEVISIQLSDKDVVCTRHTVAGRCITRVRLECLTSYTLLHGTTLSADGTIAAVAYDTDEKVMVFNTITGEVLSRWQELGRVKSLTISADGLTVMAAWGHRTHFWINDPWRDGHTSTTCRVIWRIKDGTVLYRNKDDSAITFSALSHDGSLVLMPTNGSESVVDIRNEEKKIRFSIDRHTSTVIAAAFSRDSSLLITASEHRKCIIWRVSTGKAEHKLCGLTRRPTSVNLSGDNRLAIGSCFGSFVIWSVKTGQMLRRQRGLENTTNCILNFDGSAALTFQTKREGVRKWHLVRYGYPRKHVQRMKVALERDISKLFMLHEAILYAACKR